MPRVSNPYDNSIIIKDLHYRLAAARAQTSQDREIIILLQRRLENAKKALE
jgi:hypothetical protein